MKIKSPDKTYTGTSRYGDTVLAFQDGVADHKGKLPPGVRLYLQGAGYGIDSEAEDVATEQAPADPRDLTHEQLGTPLRDAAVDPKPTDFLAPTNAGLEGEAGNPHGPNVVSPEIHASQGVRPVKAGEVHVADAAKQEAAEVAHTEASRDNGDLTGLNRPAGNASHEVWTEYATAQGKDVGGLGRDEIRALFN